MVKIRREKDIWERIIWIKKREESWNIIWKKWKKRWKDRMRKDGKYELKKKGMRE